jgi:ribosomal protein S25
MRRLRRRGVTCEEIAAQYGVHGSVVSRVVRGLAWK